ncbi:MAG: hypothetical protein MI741_05505, partial [Rhodospirillales bacterium]|nr:hypothetical protein [Rhodospirillales bacterium]
EGLGADVGKALLRTFKQVTDDELGIKTFDESELTKSWQQGAKDAAEKLADDFGTHLRKRFDEIAKTTGWFANLFQGLSGSTIPFQGLLNFDAGGDSKMPNLNISNEKSRSAQLLGADALFRQLLTGIAGGGQNDPHERAAKAAEKQLRTMIDVSKNTALLSKVADKLDEILQKPNAAVAAP